MDNEIMLIPHSNSKNIYVGKYTYSNKHLNINVWGDLEAEMDLKALEKYHFEEFVYKPPYSTERHKTQYQLISFPQEGENVCVMEHVLHVKPIVLVAPVKSGKTATEELGKGLFTPNFSTISNSLFH